MGELIDIPQSHFTQPGLGHTHLPDVRFGLGLGRVWRLGNGGCRHSSSCYCSSHRGGGSHATADGGSHGDSRAAAEYPQPYTGSYKYTRAHAGSRTDACPHCRTNGHS